ncbi:ATP-grasp domain-containing protein [Streptomyces sp. RPT161]|uniref:ATP-grasp domain-containing protein n=1 Tax=Streptomyces sp. RPT161 TaxID=3015993 RepID=UPI0022B8D09F|nr:ATP-grasp domain-containing protein [Streptomyces sp. RPT161]
MSRTPTPPTPQGPPPHQNPHSDPARCTAVLLNPRDLVIRAAHRLGVSTVIATVPGGPEPVGASGPVLRTPWHIDPGELIDELRALELPAPVSCFGFGELGCAVSAVVNRELGWPGNPPQALEAFKDKARLRSLVGDRAGAPVAHLTCLTKDEILPATDRIGFPCVVKPVDGTGSSGVRYLTGPSEAEHYLSTLDFQTPHLVEEFLTGTEYSVEAISSPAGHRILAITEKMTTGAPHFVETGHTLPVHLDPADQAAIGDLVTATLDAAGYRYGPSHTEVMLTAAGPRLIESHGRPGGDRISDMLELALGEDVFEQAMANVLGLPAPTEATRTRVAGIRYVTFDRAAAMPVIDTAPVAALPGVAEVSVCVPAGEYPPEIRKSGDRHGFVVATGDTRDGLEHNLARAVRALTAAEHAVKAR